MLALTRDRGEGQVREALLTLLSNNEYEVYKYLHTEPC